MENFKGTGGRRAIFLLVVVCSILCISMVSAWEFDNIKSYNPDTREVTITNALGFGDEIGKARLNTPLNVEVARGYQKVAEFELWAYQDYNDALKQFSFIDMKNSKTKINRDYDLKYLSYGEVEIIDYKIVCSDVWNVSNNSYSKNCEKAIDGSHYETQPIWNKITPADLKKNDKLTIGVFTNVEEGDYIDWVPIIYGVEIEEWATWSESLKVDVISYWKLDETSGTTAADELGINDLNNLGLTINQVGILGKSYLLDTNIDLLVKTNPSGFEGATAISGSFWVNVTEEVSDVFLDIFHDLATDEDLQIRFEDGNSSLLGLSVYDGVSEVETTNYNDYFNKWTHISFIVNATNAQLWINGVNKIHNSVTFSMFSGITSLNIGNNPSVPTRAPNGNIDEIGFWNRSLTPTEIISLYGSGTPPYYYYGTDALPIITLNSPSSTNYTTSQSLDINFTASDNLELSNIQMYVNGVLNQSNTSGVNNSNYIFPLILSDGNYTIYGTATDNNSEQTNSNLIQINIDTIFPTMNIESPTGTSNYILIGNNETLNVTFTDANLDSCWYNYNGTNTTIDGCLSGVKNSTLFLIEVGNTNMTIYANDSFGNENSTFINWSYNLTINSQTYPSTSVESATETYIANLTYLSETFNVITASLTLNGTEYVGTRTGSGNSAIFTTTAIMPTISILTNFTSYWTIDLTDASGTIEYNLTSHNVSVEIINLSICGSPHTIPFWNFTILNESNNAEINSTFEGTFTVKAIGSTTENSFSYSDSSGNNSQYDFCISPSIESYNLDADIKLTKSGYVDKFYNFRNINLTNSTREDNLYMLSTGDSTSFIIHVVDVSGTDIEEAEVRVQRYYTGTGTWVTTEIVTTNYLGEAVGHLLSEDADYRFLVYQDDINIWNSTSTKITCPSTPCTVTLTIPLTITPGYEEVEDLDSTLTFSDATNIFTYTYSDSSGSFSRARLLVTRIFPTNSTLTVICNNTKATADGVMTCNINTEINGTYRASAYITRDSDEFLDARLDVAKGSNIYTSLGEDGVLWGFFLLIGIVMLGITRPSLAIVWGIFGTLFLGISGIIKIGSLSIVAIIAIGIILLMRIGRE